MKAEENNAHSYQAVSSKVKSIFVVEHWGPIGESFEGN